MSRTSIIIVRLAVLAALIAATPVTGAACAIPVFRYALERWPSDLFEVDVFHHGPLSAADAALVSSLEDRSLVNGGTVNLEVVRCDVDGNLDADLREVWDALDNPPLPYVVVRAPGGRNGSPLIGKGPLAELPSSWGDANAERELLRRILAGDSIVWVVLTGRDTSAAEATAKQIEANFTTLVDNIPLPPGIGLPGSHLMASIPLEIRFSVLRVPHDDLATGWLRKTAMAMSQEPITDDDTLILPVFGRGRALPPLKPADVDADSMEELSRFLCGACSCQVKELNPGFDLLVSINWDEQLFDPDAPPLPSSASRDAAVTSTEPEMVAIPVGTSTPVEPLQPVAAEQAPSADTDRGQPSDVRPRVDAIALSLGILVTVAVFVFRRRRD